MVTRKMLFVAAAAATMLAANAEETRRPMALVVMVDGLRADAVQSQTKKI